MQWRNMLVGIVGGVVHGLRVVVLVGLVRVLPASVWLLLFLIMSVVCARDFLQTLLYNVPILFLCLTQWLCFKPYSLGKSDGLLLE